MREINSLDKIAAKGGGGEFYGIILSRSSSPSQTLPSPVLPLNLQEIANPETMAQAIIHKLLPCTKHFFMSFAQM